MKYLAIIGEINIFCAPGETRLKAGDEIVTANGRPLSDMSHFVALKFLKSLPDGAVHLSVRRHNTPSNK